jgi:hypothetical protein
MAKTPSEPESLPAPRAAKGRTLAEFLPLRRAEQVLLDACREGRIAKFKDGERPEEMPADPEDRLRSDFVRFLCLGGDDAAPVHEAGVEIQGGWIEADDNGNGFNFSNANLLKNIVFHNTQIVDEVILQGATGSRISFQGSSVKGINGDGLLVIGDLFLSDGFKCTGEVRLLGVQVGGDLYLSNGQFEEYEGRSIYCDGADIKGALFFRSEKLVEFPKLSVIGKISLTNANVGRLVDDKAALQEGEKLVLDGFRYRSIGSGPTDATTRIIWLKRQRPDLLSGDNFRPQPWTHLISVLRRMGHADEADEVAIAFQKQRYDAGAIKSWLGRRLHKAFGLIAGFGYRPARLLKVMVAVWFFCGAIYWAAAMNGGFGPSNPLVFNHPDYKACTAKERGNWYWCDPLPGEYTTFQPWLYSLDLILPLVELQQDKDWAPIIPTPPRYKDSLGWLDNTAVHARKVPDITLVQPLPPDGGRVPWFNWTAGQFARVVMWFEILFGWVASLLLVAVLTGLTNREKNDES